MPERDGLDRLQRFTSMTPRMRARAEVNAFLSRLSQLGVMIVAVLMAGTIGFTVTEHVSAWDGFVHALDTVATVGSVPAHRSTGSEIVKVVLIVLGVGTLFYALVTVT